MRTWLTEPKAADNVSVNKRGNMCLLLRVVAKLVDRSQVQRVVRAHDDTGAGAATRNFCARDRVGQGIEAGTPVLFLYLHTHQT